MKLLAENNHSFVAAKDEDSSIETLVSRLSAARIGFFDLDDNLAKSPAKIISKKAIGTNHFSPDYIFWCVETAISLFYSGKQAESEKWQKYADKFLFSDKSKSEIDELFTDEFIAETVYPSLKEYLSVLSCHKCIVSRNILEITCKYMNFLEMDANYPEIYNKAQFVQNMITINPGIHNYLVEGDSCEDAEMIDRIRFYDEDCIGIQCMNSFDERKFDKNFDYAVSKDRTAIKDLLTK
ncbi:MAG: hypothetical protein ACLFPQ_01810 [Candidatus Woesearchaeota archaeon]